MDRLTLEQIATGFLRGRELSSRVIPVEVFREMVRFQEGCVRPWRGKCSDDEMAWIMASFIRGLLIGWSLRESLEERERNVS